MGYTSLVLVIAVGVVGAEQVTTTVATTTTTTTTTTATSTVVNINDACSNGCKDSDPSYWCGMNKKDSDGRVVRCVEQTVNGGNCMGACERKSEAYYWCMTNTVKVGGGAEWWVGYKRISKIRPNTQFRPKFGFLFNRTEPSFQKFGFGLTETEIREKNSASTEF